MKTSRKSTPKSKSTSPEVTPAIQIKRLEPKEFGAVYKVKPKINEQNNKYINNIDQVVYNNKNA